MMFPFHPKHAIISSTFIDSNKNMDMRLKTRGFSLVELIIVILLLGVLGIFFSIIWSDTSVGLDAQTSLFASDLRYAQNLSITQHQRFRLTIISSNQYKFQNGSGVDVIIPNRSNPIELEEDITFSSLPTNKIIFDSKGRPYDANSNPLITATIFQLTADGDTSNVTIYPETGRIIP